jgi:hypothetical protein
MKPRYAVIAVLLLTLLGSQAVSQQCRDACRIAQTLSGVYTCVSHCSGKARIIYRSSSHVICVNEKDEQSSGEVNFNPSAYSITGCFNLIGVVAADYRSIEWFVDPHTPIGNEHIWVREECKCP